MKYEELKFSDLRKMAVERGVFKPGMNTASLVEVLTSLDMANGTDANLGQIASGVSTVAEEPKETKDVLKGNSGVVVFNSLDGRVLEVSINVSIWKGKSITVPVDVAEDVARLLKDGGYIYQRID